jgi:hypothetical protein
MSRIHNGLAFSRHAIVEPKNILYDIKKNAWAKIEGERQDSSFKVQGMEVLPKI